MADIKFTDIEFRADIDFRLKCWYKEGCNLAKDSCEKVCPRYLEMNCLINTCGMKDATRYLKELVPKKSEIEAYKRLKEIKDNVVSFVENGKNLYITAPNVQTGKTSWSLKILYKYFDEIWSGNGFRTRGYFVYVPEFLSKARSFEYRDTAEFKKIDKVLKKADLVIWDDITSIYLNQNDQNLLNLYIDKRFMEDKANIFNGYKVDDLKPYIGDKLANRLKTNCEVIELKGASRIK